MSTSANIQWSVWIQSRHDSDTSYQSIMSITVQYPWSKHHVWYGWTQLHDAAMPNMKDDLKSIFTSNIVKHITSPRIWTFTVLLSLALHTAGQRPLEGSWAVMTPRLLWSWLQRIQFTTNLPGWNDYYQQINLMNLIVYYSKYLICLK